MFFSCFSQLHPCSSHVSVSYIHVLFMFQSATSMFFSCFSQLHPCSFHVSVSYINVFIVARRSALLRSANLRKVNKGAPNPQGVEQNNEENKNSNRIQLEADEEDDDKNDSSSDSDEHAISTRGKKTFPIN